MKFQGTPPESVKWDILFREIKRLCKVAPSRITTIWVCNIIETALEALNPWVIGKCIDALVKRKYFWLFILIGAELTYMFSCALHRYMDTRLYSRIVEEESCQYYERIIQSNENNSTISSRLNLIDDIPDYIQTGIPHFVNVIIGILISIIILFIQSGLKVFLLAVATTVLVPIITRKEIKDIFSNEKRRKDIDEKREECITSRNVKEHAGLIKQTLRLLVADSNLDVKMFCKTYFSQTILLVTTLLVAISNTQWTVGLLFSTITYIQILNANVDEINGIIISLQDLAETANRLYGCKK